MRRRFQQGSLRKCNGRWVAQWWDCGSRKKLTLGKISEITKSDAQQRLAAILAPINGRHANPSPEMLFGDFVRDSYLPFFKRKWKRSTAITNEDRLRVHLMSAFGGRRIGDLSRKELQEFLDGKAAAGLSYSVVAHLRWDLRHILKLAMADGHVVRNAAAELYVPREAKRPVQRVMNMEEVRRCLSTVELREELILRLAVFVGLRPGEIFGLKCGRIQGLHAEIRERVYRNQVDTPKTWKSVRDVALPNGTSQVLQCWLNNLPSRADDAWLFPSERLTTPLSRDNVWRRHILPHLREVGLGWVNFHVLRRTHASLQHELGCDAKTAADQLGHSVDVNQNVYTATSVVRRKEAVDVLEATVQRVN